MCQVVVVKLKKDLLIFHANKKTGDYLSYDILTKLQADWLNINDYQDQEHNSGSNICGKYIVCNLKYAG